MKDVFKCAGCQHADKRFFRIESITFKVIGYQIGGFGAGFITIDKEPVSKKVLLDKLIGFRRKCPRLGIFCTRNVKEEAKCVNKKEFMPIS